MSFSIINGLKYSKSNRLKSLFLIVTCSFLFASYSNAQQVNASITLDSTTIVVGGQIDMKIELSQPTDVTVDFPLLNDTVTRDIQIIEKGQVDTTKLDNNRIVLTQLYRITSFDSGLHYVPPMLFEMHKGDFKQTVLSNELSLNVVNPFKDVNPEKGIFDIKGVKDSPFKFAEILNYIYYIGGGLIILALIIWVLIRYIFKTEKKTVAVKNTKPSDPPHVIAIRELDKIKEEKLWEHNRTKEFYTRVTTTLREYIESRYHIQALEQTSFEILTELKKQATLDNEIFSNLKQVLELSDLVKFAKFNPLPDENGLSMMNAYFFIEKTKENIIKSLEEEKERILNENSGESEDRSL